MSTTQLNPVPKTSQSYQEEQFQKLREPFPADRILTVDKSYTDRTTGRRVEVLLSYVGHADVTDRLLAVDPFWTWEPLSVDANGQPVLDLADENTVGLWIKLSVAGVTRLGYGSVKRIAKEPIKELIGDALRNAAMRFGVALDLWRKDLGSLDHVEAAPAPAPAPRTPAGQYPGQPQRPQQPQQPQQPAPAPRAPAPPRSGANAKGRIEVMGLSVLNFDWNEIQNEVVGGNGKKKAYTWGQLSEPTGDHEHYLDWCFQNTQKEQDQGKAPTAWMSKAVITYGKLRERQDAQTGEMADGLPDYAPAPAGGGEDGDVPF